MEKEHQEAPIQPSLFNGPTPVDTPSANASQVTLNMDATVSFPPVPRTTTIKWEEDKETQQSHAQEAFDLVQTFTNGHSSNTRPKNGGVLSNLIRLGMADRRLKATQQQEQQAAKKKKRPTLYKSKSSLGSQSWSMLGASHGMWSSTPTQSRSARTSLDLTEDPYTLAEQGTANYVHQLQERMQITADIADILQRQEFIIKLGKGLIRTGAPSHRIVSEAKYSFVVLSYYNQIMLIHVLETLRKRL